MKTPHVFRIISAAFLACLGSVAASGQGDPAVIERIIIEGKNNNQVWQHLEHLSREIGPRLTGSTRAEEANNWTLEQFKEWGLQNCHLHEWGMVGVRFDRGPSSARMVEPTTLDFEFTSLCWAPGTDGPVRGRVVKEPKSLEEVETVKDSLAGAWILSQGAQRGRRRGVVAPGTAPEVREQISAALKEAGIAGYIFANRSDLVLTYSGKRWSELTESTLDELTAQDVAVYVRRSDYDAMNSRIFDGETIDAEVDLNNTLTEGPFPVYNTVAEIPGTEWPEQVVIISAHLDSWDGPGAMGTQDNGTGSSVTLEAARLLMVSGAKPKRTIRFILWTGEEQGLLGARAYVNSLSETEKANISACFVDDAGTGYQGGVSCIESMAPMLREATAPLNEAFPDMPVAIRVTERFRQGGGSDHAAFNQAGIPGFFWDESGSSGQEGKNYQFIHHTQHDTPRYAVRENLVQSSTCAAITAYNLACADTLLPREELRGDVADAGDAEGRRPWDRDREGGGDQPQAVVVNDPSGEWDAKFMVGENPDENRTFSIILQIDEEGKLTGRTQSQMGSGEIIKGEFDREAGSISFTTDHEQYGEIQYTAKFDEQGRMIGSLGINTFSAQFMATKK